MLLQTENPRYSGRYLYYLTAVDANHSLCAFTAYDISEYAFKIRLSEVMNERSATLGIPPKSTDVDKTYCRSIKRGRSHTTQGGNSLSEVR